MIERSIVIMIITFSIILASLISGIILIIHSEYKRSFIKQLIGTVIFIFSMLALILTYAYYLSRNLSSQRIF